MDMKIIKAGQDYGLHLKNLKDRADELFLSRDPSSPTLYKSAEKELKEEIKKLEKDLQLTVCGSKNSGAFLASVRETYLGLKSGDLLSRLLEQGQIRRDCRLAKDVNCLFVREADKALAA